MRAIIEPEGPPAPDAPDPPFGTRLMWFVGIALAAAAATVLAAYALKALLPGH